MVIIKYYIPNSERERLKKVKNILEFEYDMNTVVGQFEFKCNSESIGFIVEDIPYDGEFILTWLERLNEVIYKLNTNKFVAIYIPDSANCWLAFECVGEIIRVSKGRLPLLMDNENMVVTNSEYIKRYEWIENVTKKEFIREVLEVTKRFIEEIIEINVLLNESKAINRLRDIYNKMKR